MVKSSTNEQPKMEHQTSSGDQSAGQTLSTWRTKNDRDESNDNENMAPTSRLGPAEAERALEGEQRKTSRKRRYSSFSADSNDAESILRALTHYLEALGFDIRLGR